MQNHNPQYPENSSGQRAGYHLYRYTLPFKQGIKKAPRYPGSFQKNLWVVLITFESSFSACIKTRPFIFSNINGNPAAVIARSVHAFDSFFSFIFIHHFNKTKTLTLFCFAVLNNPERLYRPKITKYSS